MPNLLIIDSNSIGYQSHNTNVLTAGGIQTQAIFHFIKAMRSAMLMYPDYVPMMLWDKPAQWRYDLFPLYKSNRSDDPKKVARREEYKKQRPYIQKACEYLGIPQVSAEGYEADDLAGYLTKKTTDGGYKVVLMSGDQDWIQLVNERTVWHDPIRDLHCGLGNLAEMTNAADTQAFVEMKALMGDNSDTIPGVGGIGKDTAPNFIMQYGSVENFFKLADEDKLPAKLKAYEKRLAENTAPTDSKKYGKMLPARDAFYRNMKLMDLRNVKAPSNGQLEITKGGFNQAAFEDLCAEFAFLSILRIADDWVEPFKLRFGK